MTASRATDLPSRVGAAPRTLLVLAAVAVGFAAADTYVVVLALPDMMASAGLNIDQLQRATPIVSGFLLGYIAMLPLIGRIADLRGRVPVLVGSLVIFSVGSLVTAASYDLVTMVVGRFLQGVGGGGLVPATLALVADIWVAERRGLPLGVVGAVQELGSVIGPLYGAIVLAASTWPTIFWINLAVGLVLAAAILVLGQSARPAATPARPATTPVRPASPTTPATPATSAAVDSSAESSAFRDAALQTNTSRPDSSAETSAFHAGRSQTNPAALDWVGGLIALLALLTLALVLVAPDRLTSGLTTGLAYIPYFGDSIWTTPMAITLYALAALFVAREYTAPRPLLSLRGLGELGRAADLPGAGLLGLALAGIVLAFATADPEVEVFSPLGPWFLAGSAVAAGLFGWRQRVALQPLIPRGALRPRPAWGAVAVSFFVGAALITALVDIPIFARVTTYPDSQLGAALVLVRLLAALPVGALLGGYLIRFVHVSLLAAVGMVMAAAGFVWMAQWGLTSLDDFTATIPLVLCGFGFGLAIAPVNAALLAATRAEVHGITSALLIVARMVGMLVGISALTTIGLRRFYAVSAEAPSVREVCGGSGTVCDAYVATLTEAGIAQIHAIFWGAAVCTLVAAVLSAVLLRGAAASDEKSIAGLGL